MLLVLNLSIDAVGRACYGMEWKMVWNERRILVWNMEDAPSGMEGLKNKMEGRLIY